MTKIAALTVAFNEEELIPACIKQFRGFDVLHLILVSNKPWHGDHKPDKTREIAASYPVEVVYDYWPNQAEQFNWGLEKLQKMGYEWAIIADADEFYTVAGLEILMVDIKYAQDKYKAITAPGMDVYWKNENFRIVPEQTDNPIVAIKTSERFTDKRNADVVKERTIAKLHHFSYVRSDEGMRKKIDSFEHTNEFNKDEWYEEKWLKWHPDMQDLHPVVPSQFKQAVAQLCPIDISILL